MSPNKFYCYEHIRLDTNQPFYVGAGNHQRPWYPKRNNKAWKLVDATTRWTVNILGEFDTREEAEVMEDTIIKQYRDAGIELVNRRPDAHTNSKIQRTTEERQKYSDSQKLRFTNPIEREKISNATKQAMQRQEVKDKMKVRDEHKKTPEWKAQLRDRAIKLMESESVRSEISTKLRKWKTNKLQAPDGTIYVVEPSASTFAAQHNLQLGSLARLLRGERKRYKGWTAVQS